MEMEHESQKMNMVAGSASNKAPEQPLTTTTIANQQSNADFKDMATRWQPMNARFIIPLPYVADDRSPILAVDALPMWRQPGGTDYVSDYYPYFPVPGWGGVRTTPIAGPHMVIYGPPPPIVQIMCAHRFVRSGMKFRFRCVSNFLASGYVISGVLKGAHFRNMPSAAKLESTIRGIPELNQGYNPFMLNSFVESDVSMFRHIEVDAPYEYPLSYADTTRRLEENYALVAATATDYRLKREMRNFIILAPRGSITSDTPGAQLVYELEICASEDFDVRGFIGWSFEIGSISWRPPYLYPAQPAAVNFSIEESTEDKAESSWKSREVKKNFRSVTPKSMRQSPEEIFAKLELTRSRLAELEMAANERN